MDIIEFTENVLDIKLLDSQKKLLTYIYEHPNCKWILYPRGGRTSTRMMYELILNIYKANL